MTVADVADERPVPEEREVSVRIDRLQRQFGGVIAVEDASFDIRRGSITGLIGPNGAGKSTVVSMIGGSIKPSSGTITFEGVDITALPAYERARRGLTRTYQLSSEFRRLTVLENLLVAVPRQRGESLLTLLAGRRWWRQQEGESLIRARELLERFGMAAKADEYAGQLSGGQKRLVEIMRALMTEPKVLLLDEPTAGVNPTLARSIQDDIVALARDGLAILLIEHELEMIDRLSDVVVVMALGRVLATGTMTELKGQKEVLDAYLGD